MIRKILSKLIIAVFILLTNNVSAQQIPAWSLADLKTAIDTSTGPTIFNFWATFCKPCIAELPYFQKAANDYKQKGVRLVMVSLDLKEAYPKTIASFVLKRKLTSPVVFVNESNADLLIPAVDSGWSGSIPASLFINRSKGYRHFLEEELSPQKLDAEIKKML